VERTSQGEVNETGLSLRKKKKERKEERGKSTATTRGNRQRQDTIIADNPKRSQVPRKRGETEVAKGKFQSSENDLRYVHGDRASVTKTDRKLGRYHAEGTPKDGEKDKH